MWTDDQIHGLCQRAIQSKDVQAVHELLRWKKGALRGACKKVVRRVARKGPAIRRSVSVTYQGEYRPLDTEDRWVYVTTPLGRPLFQARSPVSEKLRVDKRWDFPTRLENVRTKRWFKAGAKLLSATCTRCPELDKGHPIAIFKAVMVPTIKELEYEIRGHPVTECCGVCFGLEKGDLDVLTAKLCGVTVDEVCSVQRYCACSLLRANRGIKYVYARKYDEDGAPPHEDWDEVTTLRNELLPCYRTGKNGCTTVADVIQPERPRLRNTLVTPE